WNFYHMCVFPYALDKLKLNSAIVNGNGHNFNGGGPFYWDGTGLKGLNSSIQKPDPMMRFALCCFSSRQVLIVFWQDQNVRNFSECDSGQLARAGFLCVESRTLVDDKLKETTPITGAMGLPLATTPMDST
ncbi:uncharacterized protein LACBIDRAFT_336218, partial [Laccaria bicolor S238N-H82]